MYLRKHFKIHSVLPNKLHKWLLSFEGLDFVYVSATVLLISRAKKKSNRLTTRSRPCRSVHLIREATSLQCSIHHAMSLTPRRKYLRQQMLQLWQVLYNFSLELVPFSLYYSILCSQVSDDQLLKISLYFEGDCPDCHEYLRQQLLQLWQGPYNVTLDLVPFGNAEVPFIQSSFLY